MKNLICFFVKCFYSALQKGDNMMKNAIFNQRGFTLIELLVVVLIIGILSSVALPQYTIAVEKARLSEALQNFSHMQKDLNLYVMANGWYQNTSYLYFLGDSAQVSLDIDLGAGLDCSQNDGKACGSKYFTYEMRCYSGMCDAYIYRKKDGLYSNPTEYTIYWAKRPAGGSYGALDYKTCWYNTSYPYSKKICQNLNRDWN